MISMMYYEQQQVSRYIQQHGCKLSPCSDGMHFTLQANRLGHGKRGHHHEGPSALHVGNPRSALAFSMVLGKRGNCSQAEGSSQRAVATPVIREGRSYHIPITRWEQVGWACFLQRILLFDQHPSQTYRCSPSTVFTARGLSTLLWDLKLCLFLTM